MRVDRGEEGKPGRGVGPGRRGKDREAECETGKGEWTEEGRVDQRVWTEEKTVDQEEECWPRGEEC